MDGLSKLVIDAKEKNSGFDEDEILVTRCRNGEKDAFGILARKYQDSVYRLIYRLLGRTSDIEDIAQEVFIRAYKGIGKFRQDATFSTWLTRICINYCKKQRRKIKKDLTSLEQLMSRGRDFPAASVAPSFALEREERNQLIRQTIEKLPQKYRIVIILRYFEAYSCEQIAKILDCASGTVHSRLSRAHEKLRKQLESIKQNERRSE